MTLQVHVNIMEQGVHVLYAACGKCVLGVLQVLRDAQTRRAYDRVLVGKALQKEVAVSAEVQRGCYLYY